MEYNLIPRTLTLREFVEADWKMTVHTFEEPTLWQLEYFWRYIKKEQYHLALKEIWIDFRGKEVYRDTLKTLSTLIYGKIASSWEQSSSFFPGSIEFCAKRYGCTPQEFMKQTTFSQLLTFYNAIEYNTNIEIGKPQNNRKFERLEVTEEKMRQYESILEEVEEVERLMKS